MWNPKQQIRSPEVARICGVGERQARNLLVQYRGEFGAGVRGDVYLSSFCRWRGLNVESARSVLLSPDFPLRHLKKVHDKFSYGLQRLDLRCGVDDIRLDVRNYALLDQGVWHPLAQGLAVHVAAVGKGHPWVAYVGRYCWDVVHAFDALALRSGGTNDFLRFMSRAWGRFKPPLKVVHWRLLSGYRYLDDQGGAQFWELAGSAVYCRRSLHVLQLPDEAGGGSGFGKNLEASGWSALEGSSLMVAGGLGRWRESRFQVRVVL